MHFNEDGVLDPGIYTMSWEEFAAQFSFSPQRKRLLIGLEKAIKILKETNCTAIYIDGSFVTSKLEPNDWDACFDCNLKYQMDVIRAYPFDTQEELYGGELFFAESRADFYGTKFKDFFQQITGTAKKKGIVKIELNTI